MHQTLALRYYRPHTIRSGARKTVRIQILSENWFSVTFAREHSQMRSAASSQSTDFAPDVEKDGQGCPLMLYFSGKRAFLYPDEAATTHPLAVVERDFSDVAAGRMKTRARRPTVALSLKRGFLFGC